MGQTIIRPATVDDLRGIITISEEYFESSPYNSNSYRFDADYSFEYLRRSVINPNYANYVVEDQGRVVGFMVVVLGAMNFQPGVRCYVEYIYVLPDYRSELLLEQMLEQVEQLAESIDAVDILIGDIGFSSASFARRMASLGYDQQAVICRKPRK